MKDGSVYYCVESICKGGLAENGSRKHRFNEQARLNPAFLLSGEMLHYAGVTQRDAPFVLFSRTTVNNG